MPPALDSLPWLWVPLVLWAALAQTARNAAQRSLVARAGTLGATLSRFAWGLPFAGAWVLVLHQVAGHAVPAFGPAYFAWTAVGALTQLAATAFLLAAMKERNFVVGVAYSKTDVLQVALFGALLLHELPGGWTLVAMGLASAGVLLLSLPARSGHAGWAGSAALWGLASGANFAIAAVAYRAAALALPGASAWVAGGWTVLWAQLLQSLVLGAWLAWRAPGALRAMAGAWRVSTAAGAAGAAASIGWFTAYALTTAANVRTLGLVEMLFSYLVSHRLLREKLRGAEVAGLVLLTGGLLVILGTL